MIKSIDIKNFQSHKSSVLEFNKGVNIIIGQSDSGKTSILRALKWGCHNLPAGESFRSSWGGKTLVKLEIDKMEISRVRDTGVNSYFLNDSKFSAFGNNVPDEIAKVINLNQINLQQQLDSPFLLSETPGNVAQHFNKVAHLDQIDEGLRQVSQLIRGLEQSKKADEINQARLEEELKKYKPLQKLEIKLEVYEQSSEKLTQLYSLTNKLKSIISQTAAVDIEIQKWSGLLTLDKLLQNILELKGQNQTKENEIDTLTHLIADIEEVNSGISKGNGLLKLEKDIQALSILLTEKELIKSNSTSLKELTADLTICLASSKTWEDREKTLTKEFNKNFPNQCPLCGNKITKNHEANHSK